MRLAELVATSAAVAATRSRRQKVERIAELLRGSDAGTGALAAAYLAGQPRQQRLDVGWAALRDTAAAPAAEPALTLAEVDAALQALADASGPGSRRRRLDVLAGLLGRATAEEQPFLRGLIGGELRHGALAGVVALGVAAAADVPPAAVQRALMLAADLGTVARLATEGGANALAGVSLRLFRPLQPMLAAPAADLQEALDDLGDRAALEVKLDGARIQVHRQAELVRVYSRNLRDITARVPEVVDAVAALPVTAVILDGEALGVDAAGRPRPFQESMGRFGSDRAAAEQRLPLTPFFFDCLHLDGVDLIDQPLHRRAAALAATVPPARRVRRTVPEDAAAAAAFWRRAVDDGHEGVVVKHLDSPYTAGRRGGDWRKVKPVHTLDLVVLAAEWGSGRRRGWLSNIHLGARDPDRDTLVMLGKTFKGMTDDMLQWQTRRFLALERDRDTRTVYVRPEQVVEVAVDGVQTSSRYPGGVALRFARVRRYREDKDAAAADTIATVRALGSRPGGSGTP